MPLMATAVAPTVVQLRRDRSPGRTIEAGLATKLEITTFGTTVMVTVALAEPPGLVAVRV